MAENSANNRDKILEAFLSLLAETSFEKIGLAAVAGKAGVSLAEMRKYFGSTFDMVAGFVRATDEKVLAGGDVDDAQATTRDRLFDVLMRRFEVLTPNRAAVRSLACTARRNPRFALGMNKLAVRSQQWMMSAAGLDSSGLKGGMRAQALAVMFARVMRVWLDDEDPGLARTMAELDRELAAGARLATLFDDLCRFAPRCRPRRTREARHRPPPEPQTMQA
ncbi:MAG TPA: TetR/AcrR family transcriptional regulator [Xanthobacteraceae bacterium]|jgi:AcrR family transcriptional regulator|nr:TetR/AcrR family transcriptional regulator [Xanthobacteraceae bacterium]